MSPRRHIPPVRCWWAWVALCCGLLAAGCAPLVPATTPPQLEHTPGRFIVVEPDLVDTPTFRFHYPRGWRVVKASIAGAPMRIVIVSPDDAVTVTLSEAPLPPATPEPGIVTHRRTVTLADGRRVYVHSSGPPAQRARLMDVLDWVVGSLAPGTVDDRGA